MLKNQLSLQDIPGNVPDQLSHFNTSQFKLVYILYHNNPLKPENRLVFQCYHFKCFSLRIQTTYPLLDSLGNPTKAALGCCETHKIFNYVLNQIVFPQLMGLLGPKAIYCQQPLYQQPGFDHPISPQEGLTQKRESKYACEHSLTNDLGHPSPLGYQ